MGRDERTERLAAELQQVGAFVSLGFRLLDDPDADLSVWEQLRHPPVFRAGRVIRMPDGGWALYGWRFGNPKGYWPLEGVRVVRGEYRGFTDADEVWDATRFHCEGPSFPAGIEFRVWNRKHDDQKFRSVLGELDPHLRRA